ncbi:MAG: LLM class flavin-dependent oxidoreductase, partial [Acidimicrobiales bacterium]
MRPFRFGIQCRGPADRAGWRALARRVEDLGWSTLTIADHFDEALAPIPGLMAAADATTTLRVGTMVLANDYRHPVVVAKEAATLDVLTDGRFELGIGAGWMTTDYAAAGLPLDPPGVRVD